MCAGVVHQKVNCIMYINMVVEYLDVHYCYTLDIEYHCSQSVLTLNAISCL